MRTGSIRLDERLGENAAVLGDPNNVRAVIRIEALCACYLNLPGSL